MAKLARFIIKNCGQCIDIPIDDGNSFANSIMTARQQGFVLDGRTNAYIPMSSVHYAFQIETEIMQGMTKQ